MTAMGFIETWGLIPAIEAADAMVKAAEVRLLERNQVGSGLVTVTVSGSVAAVQASVEAGAAAVARIPGAVLVSRHVIARPDQEVSAVVRTTPVDAKAEVEVKSESAAAPATPVVETAGGGPERYSEAELRTMKVAELRKLVRSLTGAKVVKGTKNDLIEAIVNVYRKIEE